MIETTLSDILHDIGHFSWKDCVYVKSADKVKPSTPCLVINDNEAELGADGFTPLDAEKRNMEEFLSIQDLQGVLKNLEHSQGYTSIDTKCAAATYYFENDAFMPMPTEFDLL